MMSIKLFYLVPLVLVLSLVVDVQADIVSWTDTTYDHLWSTARNWSTGSVPTPDDEARIGMLPGATITNEDAVAYGVQIGYGSASGALTVDGGSLSTTDWFLLSSAEGSNGKLNMFSGTIRIGTHLHVGMNGSAILNMTGGTIEITDCLNIPQGAGGTGHVDLYGGTITAASLEMRKEADSVGTMNIVAGTLIINGDELSKVQGYIDNGWITAYEGNGTLHLDYDVTNEDKTTLKATHMLNPIPADDSNVPVDANQLQWTLPEPSLPDDIVTCVVYFGTDPIVENNRKIVKGQAVESAPVMLDLDTTYYWALDLYDSGISETDPYMLCPTFTFTTKNQPPIVNAGADVVTWLEDGLRTVNLDATIIDDGMPIPCLVQWTLVSEPNEAITAIETPTDEDTSITMTARGEYVLHVMASDGEYSVSDTVTINVYSDGCEAARSFSDYVPLVGDLNGDCLVDNADMTLLLENWLNDNSLTDD